MTYFSPDYTTARGSFLRLAEKAGARIESLELEAKGPAGESLAVDIAWFGSANPRRAVLHSSGIHGVEGFAGSAIQLQLLDSLPAIPRDSALVVVHILNPYGMAWLRRVNEQNVDLNRNFVEPGEYRGAPPAYAAFDSLLNPPSLPREDLFLIRAQWLVLRHGMTAMKQAVAAGQWEYPRGLFFGGTCLQEGAAKYQTFVAARLSGAERVFSVDVHTGLGKFGEDTLLVEKKDFDVLRRTLGERVRPLEAAGGPAYQVRGGLQAMLFRVLSKSEVLFVGQEFGTYGPIKAVRALRDENRWHHYGEGTLAHPAKRRLKEFFCPDDESWRESVLRRGRGLLEDILVMRRGTTPLVR